MSHSRRKLLDTSIGLITQFKCGTTSEISFEIHRIHEYDSVYLYSGWGNFKTGHHWNLVNYTNWQLSLKGLFQLILKIWNKIYKIRLKFPNVAANLTTSSGKRIRRTILISSHQNVIIWNRNFENHLPFRSMAANFKVFDYK